MARRSTHLELTVEQRAEADRIHAAMLRVVEADLWELTELLATKDDSNMFEATEFTVRDIVLRVEAKAVDTARTERKRGDATGRAAPALDPASRPGSSGGSPSQS